MKGLGRAAVRSCSHTRWQWAQVLTLWRESSISSQTSPPSPPVLFLPQLHGTPPSSAWSAKLFAWPSCVSSRNWLGFKSLGKRLFFFWLSAVTKCSFTNGHQHGWWFSWCFRCSGVKTQAEITRNLLVWAASLWSRTFVLPPATVAMASGDISSELQGNALVSFQVHRGNSQKVSERDQQLGSLAGATG